MSRDTETVAQTLRPYLKKALASYKEFLAKETWTDAKEFSAYHSACKNVLSHIALLIKLSADGEEENKDNPLFDWTQKAKNALQEMEDLNVDFD
ncbi:MAG: hypothetical protein IKY98_05825 [Alphaproteobacteria bacterium]|nr:hypothetical protein [Alphaproteobacteria bacterium]